MPFHSIPCRRCLAILVRHLTLTAWFFLGSLGISDRRRHRRRGSPRTSSQEAFDDRRWQVRLLNLAGNGCAAKYVRQHLPLLQAEGSSRCNDKIVFGTNATLLYCSACCCCCCVGSRQAGRVRVHSIQPRPTRIHTGSTGAVANSIGKRRGRVAQVCKWCRYDRGSCVQRM